MASVSGRIFAITGGASGIGAATCRLLAQRGAAVICIADRDSTHFVSLQESIAATSPSTLVQCAVVDVTSSEAVSAWVDSVVSTHGDLHGAANVAGIAQAAGLRSPPNILGETDDEWNRILRVNLDGVFFSTRAQVAAMKNGLADRCRRSIVNVASIAAFYHDPDVYAYGTSKQACAYFSACVAADVVSLGIRVNCVSPGVTNTPLLPQFEPKAAGLDEIQALYDSRGLAIYEADDVARTIAWLLSDDSWPVYGANINVGAHGP